MHFYESSIITTKDGLHCQVYANQHPEKGILVKPKYIPTDRIESDALQCRFISGRKMNRLNLWAEKTALCRYIQDFKKAYPQYIFKSELHDRERLFFWVPEEHIERIYYPRTGLSELMSMHEKDLDKHLSTVHSFVDFLLESGLELKDFGVTYSTLMGHYMYNMSDINIVVYGKREFWRLMEYLDSAEHPSLRWKSESEWLDFYGKRNRANIFEKNTFLKHMLSRKKSEGFFDNLLFVIFAAEKEEEAWSKWGEEKYCAVGTATVEGTVKDNHDSVVRPGCYTLGDSKLIGAGNDCNVEKVVFYSRDYTLLAYKGETIRARGILERVEPTKGREYHRIVTGYLDSYVSERREEEFIKVI
jgi:predicted nucleotidyltransferase